VPAEALEETFDMANVAETIGEQAEGKGLTTATSIWLTAAIGIAVGLGRDLAWRSSASCSRY
jgi:hypothetical protein